MKKHGSNSRQQTHHDSAPITHPDTKKILGPDRSNGLHHEPAGAQEAEARHFAAVRKHKQRQCAASRGQNTPACKRWQGKAQQSTPHTPNCERTDAPLRIPSCILGVEIQIWGVKHSTLLMLALRQCKTLRIVKHCEYRYVAVCQCFTCKTPRIVEPLLLRPTLRRKMQNSSSPLYWKKASFARLLDVPKFQMHRLASRGGKLNFLHQLPLRLHSLHPRYPSCEAWERAVLRGRVFPIRGRSTPSEVPGWTPPLPPSFVTY